MIENAQPFEPDAIATVAGTATDPVEQDIIDQDMGHPDVEPVVSHQNAYVHGARGLFSISLFVFHVLNSGLPPEFINSGPLRNVTQSLQFGVELFFGISGIVIIGAFQHSRSVGSFLINRITRIAPVLWVTVSVVLCLLLVSGSRLLALPPLAMVGVLAGNYLALPNMLPLPLIHPAAWSLSYEFTFYLIIVLFGLLHTRSPWLAKLTAGILAATILAFRLRGLFFLSGVVLALGMLRGERVRAIMRHPLLWLIIFLAAWQWTSVQVGGHIDAAFLTTLIARPVLLVTVCIGFLAGTFVLGGIYYGYGSLSRLLVLPVMQWLGTISYSLYLWQTPVEAVVKRGMYMLHIPDVAGPFSQLAMFCLALPPTLLVSHLSQVYLETAATKKLRKILKHQ